MIIIFDFVSILYKKIFSSSVWNKNKKIKTDKQNKRLYSTQMFSFIFCFTLLSSWLQYSYESSLREK